MSSLVSEVYYSGVEVIIETMSHGVIDVSDDVRSVSVTRRLDGISTASFTLVNYSTYSSGRYNGVIHVGDRMHIAFIKDSQRIDAFTGRVYKVPVVAYNESSYTVECQDVIGDLKYIFWDPYSLAAQQRYMLSMDSISSKSAEYAQTNNVGDDNGIGIMLNDFLTAENGVCHLPSDAVRIAAFPSTSETMQAIIRMTVRGDVDTDAMLESVYTMLFGGSTMFVDEDDVDNAIYDATNGEEGKDSTGSSGSSGSSGSNGLSSLKGTSSDMASVLRRLLGSPAVNANNNTISGRMRVKTNAYDFKKWSDIDGNNHSGCYGLTKAQMKKHAEVDSEARDCNELLQQTAITSIFNSMSSKNVAKNVFYYLTGQHLYDDDSGKNDSYFSQNKLGQFIRGLELNGTKYTSRKKFIEKIADLLGKKYSPSKKNTSDLNKGEVPAPSSKTSDLNKGEVPAPSSSSSSTKAQGKTTESKASPEAQAKWDRFASTYAAGRPISTFDGNQCWSLYSVYNNIMFGWAAASGGNLQGSWSENGCKGNGPYYTHAIEAYPDVNAQYVRLGPNDKAQRGDAVFWWYGPGSNNIYGHVAIVTDDDGTNFTVLEQGQGFSNPNVVHQNTYSRSDGKLAGFYRPKNLGGDLTGSSSGSSGSSSGSAAALAEQYAKNETFKLFKYVMQFDPRQTLNSEMLGPGDGSDTGLALVNDKPALEFVSTCCKASMRSYMSMPDGRFVAFVPDWFGWMMPSNAKGSTIDIPVQEVISFRTDFDKSSYCSHYMLLTNESFPDPTGMFSNPLNQTLRALISSGFISFQYQGDNLMKLMDISCTGCSNLDEVMQRWGVNVITESNEYIIDHQLTSVYALYQFLRYWANCFKTQVQITFRPEIIPGLRLRFPHAGQSLFVESVSHSWNAMTGGTTSVTLVAPVNSNTGQVGVSGS